MFNGLYGRRGRLGMVFAAATLVSAFFSVLNASTAQAQDFDPARQPGAADTMGATGGSAMEDAATDVAQDTIHKTDTQSQIKETLTELAMDGKISDHLMTFVLFAGKMKNKLEAGEKLSTKQMKNFAIALREIADSFMMKRNGLPENITFAQSLYESAAMLNPNYAGYEESANWAATIAAYRSGQKNLMTNFNYE